jgi:peptidoglycan/LPS O-acetylase OafA/YrhL
VRARYHFEFVSFLLKYYLDISLYGGMLYVTYGRIGVAIFLFASGCSLAYTDSEIRTLEDIKNFYSKRLSRIYPAYWAAIIFSIMMEPWILQRSFSNIEIFKYIIGFQAWGARTGMEALGKINGPFWFLTPLLSLYLMYPLILYLIAKRPNLSILSFFVISFVSTYLMLRYYSSESAWSPLYWLFVFGLGIYLMKMNWYPRIESKIRN